MIFKLFSAIDGWGISCQIALRQMTLDLTYDKSTLVQVMAWCCQAPNHYLSQCWPRYLSPYGVPRLQWVNSLALGRFGWNFRLVIFRLQSRINIYIYIYWVFPVERPSGECQKTLLMINQHWFMWWVGAVRQQAITWAHVVSVLYCYMVSIGHNELTAT